MTDPKPITFAYENGNTKDTLIRARIPEQGLVGMETSNNPTINVMTRKSNGFYSETNGLPLPREGLSALDVIKEAQGELGKYKNAKVALVIKDHDGKVVKSLNYAEASEFLKQQKTQELSQGHAVKELTGMIKHLAKDKEGLDGYENTDLRSYAKSHGLKLDYKDMAGDKDSIQIQDIKSGKVLNKVDGVKIGTKDSNYR